MFWNLVSDTYSSNILLMDEKAVSTIHLWPQQFFFFHLRRSLVCCCLTSTFLILLFLLYETTEFLLTILTILISIKMGITDIERQIYFSIKITIYHFNPWQFIALSFFPSFPSSSLSLFPVYQIHKYEYKMRCYHDLFIYTI